MANPIPLSKAQAAFDELCAIAQTGSEPDAFTLARLARDAKSSINEDPIDAFQALGIIASFRWDEAGVIENYERALRMGGSTTVQRNYVRALSDVNQYRKALRQYQLAVEREPEDLSLLRAAISLHFTLGEFGIALDLLDKLTQRTVDLGEEMIESLDVILNARKFGIDEVTIQESLECALKFLTSKKVRTDGFRYFLDRTEGGGCLYIDVWVYESHDRARDLDEEFTPVLFEQVERPQLSSIVVSLEALGS